MAETNPPQYKPTFLERLSEKYVKFERWVTETPKEPSKEDIERMRRIKDALNYNDGYF